MAAAYDYIVAGGGSGGCALAARLAEDPEKKVLLLEAGGSGNSPYITMPAGNGFLFGNPRFDWGFESLPQKGLNGRRIYYPRGRALGGSSIMNGMIYMRGNPRDYDRWRQLGLEGWAYDDLLPYFRRSEGSGHRRDGQHGTEGPLKTSPAGNFTPLDRIFIQATQQAGHPFNEDFNNGDQRGVGRVDVTVTGGRRQTSARAYLRRRPPNLAVKTGIHVSKVLFDGRRACGVEAIRGRDIMKFHAGTEVILSLGAFGSPQVLQLSGIGPAQHLHSHGIAVTADLPGVGENLTDHLNMPVQFACRDPQLTFARFQRLDKALWLGTQWFLAKRGPGAAPFWSTCLFDAHNGVEEPTLQIYLTPMVVKEGRNADGDDGAGLMEKLGRRILVRGTKKALNGFQFDINQMQPDSRGTVRLASPDPTAPPAIDPHFLTEEKEMRELITGIRHMREIIAQPAFEGICGGEISPGIQASTDFELAAIIRETVTTGHHPVGTCRMGPDHDGLAVLDRQLRVRGVTGLRVCDASVFPTQIAGNPNAPVMMIAEKAADMILGKAPPDGGTSEVRNRA